ncbi:response regulator transcription factor [Flavobacterium gilvum]|uniref:Response regulator n=1 Tax=Flavobacterium gilvum TaxID=1492737 RepID=A0AAC9N5T6_9FLAO|nr:response regulator [Flavobacterium gilvum]AOW09732.1 response regulator [Flavobacterium gilvum]KFC57690.1 transcriptional regulator [Flavobacterium gilvum]
MNNSDLKILIAEDDVLMIKILEFILKKEGYQVISCKDGLTAIEKIPTLIPDLIITDIMLPYRSGLEIIGFSKDNYENIPIIVVSALGEEEGTVIEAFNLGADDFVSKPFNPNELLLRVRRLFSKKNRFAKQNKIEEGVPA